MTARDSLTIDESKEQLWQRLRDFVSLDAEMAREKYRLGEDVRDWKVASAQSDIRPLTQQLLRRVAYRPFDIRWTAYTGNSRGFHCMPRGKFMWHYVAGKNLGLLTTKAHRDDAFAHAGVTTEISEVIGLSPRTASNSVNFPLYLYPDPDPYP